MNTENVTISRNSDSTRGSFVTLIHKICTEIKPKPIHICVQCGARSSRRTRLANRECKCPKEKDSLHPTPTPDTGQYLLNGKQSPINADAAEDVSDINFGACADAIFNVEDQQEVTPDMTQNTDNLVDIDSLLSNKSEWPETSATYFIREHNNPGDGKRGLVFNSLIEKK